MCTEYVTFIARQKQKFLSIVIRFLKTIINKNNYLKKEKIPTSPIILTKKSKTLIFYTEICVCKRQDALDFI